MDYTLTYVLAGVGTLFVLIWAVLFFKYKDKYDDMLQVLNTNQYPLCELYYIGLGVIDMFHINMNSTMGRRKEKRIAQIYGERYASFYHYCILGGQITYILTFVPVCCFLSALLQDKMLAVVCFVMVFVLVYYLDMRINNAVDQRKDEILSEYPEVLSKLTLLINAGMVVREAWKQVAYTGDSALYQEMQIASEEMNNGVSEIDALYNFSQRCVLKEIRKFASILSQNLQKGGSELTLSLRYMNTESWEEKKNMAKRKGEAAGQKLMIPLMMIFVGILMMIMVPIFTNMF